MCHKKIVCFLFFCFLCALPLCAQLGSDEQLAQQYWRNGEKDKARLLYKEIYQKTPTPYIYQAYLNALLELKEYEEAEKIVRKQIKQDKKQLTVFIDLGRIYALRGESGKAEKQYQWVVDNFDASSTYAVHEIANYFYNQAQSYHWATQIYSKARTNLGDPTIYAYELANLYRIMQKIPEMMDEYLLFLQENEPLQTYIESALQSLISTDDTKKQILQIKKILLQKAQKDSESRSVQNLLIWVLLQENSFSEAVTQAKTYQIRFKDQGKKLFEVASIIAQNKVFKEAETAYKSLIALGPNSRYYKQSRIELLNLYYQQLRDEVERTQVDADNPKQKEKIEKIKTDYEALWLEFPHDVASIGLTRNLAQIYAYYTKQPDKAQHLLEETIAQLTIPSNLRAECKIDLADILLYFGNVWDATLLYSQVEKEFKQDAIGFAAKLKNAQLSYYMGDFLWAKSQFDVLKAATSKLIANDAMEYALLIKENNNADSNYFGLRLVARADAMVYRNQWKEALPLLDSVLDLESEKALWDDVYYKKAEIYNKAQKPDSALVYYMKLVENTPSSLWVDEALFAVAQISENLAIPLQAMAFYERVFSEFPTSNLAPKARQNYREIRKRILNTESK
ncbi:MAG: hypothetical protein RR256_00040 [Bacteroidales bacterium]